MSLQIQNQSFRTPVSHFGGKCQVLQRANCYDASVRKNISQRRETMKPGFYILMIVIVVSTLVVTACSTSISPAEPAQLPTGIWEGAQEAGDTDWSMTLNFDGCASTSPCAKVYYILCAGEFAFQKDEKGEYLFQENITEHADQCFSGATVHVKYEGQKQP